jgi:hypothetical protein
MSSSPEVPWSDHVQDVMTGDLVAIFAYTTPAGGVVALPVAPIGAVDRDAGTITLTTSLAHYRKLRYLLQNPKVAVAYHTREHGFSTGDEFILAHGKATAQLKPSRERNAVLESLGIRFLGALPSGPFWNWALREEFYERVIIDISLQRVTVRSAAQVGGPASVFGEQWPSSSPPPQAPPAKGTGPRMATAKLYRKMKDLPHQVLAYRGSDGYPVVAPVRITGHNENGLQFNDTMGLLPPGGRRAGLTVHAFGSRLVGFSQWVCTGWLNVSETTVVYSPHTASGLTVPPMRRFQLLAAGLVAKRVIRRARRDGSLPQR